MWWFISKCVLCHEDKAVVLPENGRKLNSLATFRFTIPNVNQSSLERMANAF
ncbi:hypothetical protein D083_2739 [Dickeya solani RNS 08.23.3.1.A]|nr:hypothetical protein D083_2739 [Dickeya solani RNS 08.23.3.1.A]